MSTTFGKRPPAPWHPLPLSEILILAGAISAAIALGRHSSNGAPLLLAGIAVTALGTLEVTLREHRSGYRSHTILLAFLVVVIFHTGVALIVAALTTPPRLLNVGLLAADIALFLVLFRVLRTWFLNARARAPARR